MDSPEIVVVTVPTSGSDQTSGKLLQDVRPGKPRKKVTFDLDLKVHTIPNRIPLYERRPASNNSRKNHHPSAFVPRPLEFRGGKDRQFLGNATSKLIVDLYTHGSHSAPTGHYYTGSRGRFVRPQRKPAPKYFNYAAKNLYSLSSLKQPAKMSRAAANLKQITDALGEHHDNVYKEYGTYKNSAESLPRVSTSQNLYQDSTSTSRPMPKVQVSTRAMLSNSAPIRQKLTSWLTKPPLPTEKDQLVPATSGPKENSHSNEHKQTILKLQTVSLSDQTPLNSPPKLVPRPPSGSKQDYRKSSRPTYSAGTYRLSISDAGKHVQEIEGDRSSSRCSTIDTYVISDAARIKNNINTTKDKMIISPNGRSVAWAATELHVRDPVLDVTVLRTPVGPSEIPYFSAWQATARPPNLSSKT